VYLFIDDFISISLLVLKKRYLDNNNVTFVSKAWLYGLNSLRVLSLSGNAVAQIRDGAWEECSNLQEL
jgi:hypothetical protein